ncbi:hypothetical protein MUY14_34885 [Amycolatopsis sp. FBCC-B4732]|uniref:hypothetical protein n=1 Tax=Amycolatopsis sp. FBCC-B4732 TaxID=3079339 RepID=UPI001FF523BE|nr:hypothetical protein [Amycolatopsis sp. FBCC-B4732]UOX86889.1 hypothetical protein MUY14_34885 [Amycolatopsis sp. FBCC-B4732]
MPLFAVPAPEPAGRELAHALATGPFSRALTLAIDHSGLGLARLKGRLAAAGVPVSTTTLSYWRTGRTRPERPESLRAVAVLEGVLGLPTRALTDLLALPGEGPATPGPVCWERLWEPRAHVVAVLHSFEAADETSLVVLSLHEVLHVDATRALTRLHVREVVRAVTEPVQSKVVVLRGCTPGHPPRLVSTRYCRPVRTEVLTEPGFVVSELVPHRSLAVGETAILEYEFEYCDGVPDTSYDRRFRHRGTEHLLEVHFAPGALPASCHSYRLDSPGGPERDVTAVSPGSPAHVFSSGGPPGIRGMRWSWP